MKNGLKRLLCYLLILTFVLSIVPAVQATEETTESVPTESIAEPQEETQVLLKATATGIPSLEKTLRENAADTGEHNGTTDDITDGYAHIATASTGDVVDYQIVSTLPAITSESTYLTAYTFVDTLSQGLTYNKNDILIEFFSDADCINLLDSWNQSEGMFTATYNKTASGDTTMTIEMTSQGLKEINTNKRVYTGGSMVNTGYSDCTVRITYKATLDSDASVTYGDTGNPNQVVLLWKRSSQNYFDTLVDDAHLFTYGIDLTKLFSDGNGNFENVEFIVHNDTDNYFIKAELNAEEGVYYMVDHVAEEKDATHFIPVESDGESGKVIIKGLEDDTYTATEVRTDNGYTMLKEDILRSVFWDMCSVSARVIPPEIPETAAPPETEPGLETDPPEETEPLLPSLHITITSKDAEEMRDIYDFTETQNEALNFLLEERATLQAMLNTLTLSSQEALAVLNNLPEDLSEERRKVVIQALSLVGKVNYFWGGKSRVMGWDSRWGRLTKVTAEGSPSTGTYRPYGLDCSGFADWVFWNVSGGTYLLGRGGGSRAQHTYSTNVSWGEVQPGDLAFYPDDSHIGIVGGWDEVGNILIIHCASGQNNVVITGRSGFEVVARPDYYAE